MLPNNSSQHSASLYSQWEASLGQIRTDWPRNSKGLIRIFCGKAFSNHEFDNPTAFEHLKKATTQVVYDTEEPKLQAISFPDEVIFITEKLTKNYTYNFPIELFSIFSQQYFLFREVMVPFTYHSFSCSQDNIIEGYLSWRKQQWYYRHRALRLKLPKESQYFFNL